MKIALFAYRFWQTKFQAWCCQKGAVAAETGQKIEWDARKSGQKTSQEKVNQCIHAESPFKIGISDGTFNLLLRSNLDSW